MATETVVTPEVPNVPAGAMNPGEVGLGGVPKAAKPDGFDETFTGKAASEDAAPPVIEQPAKSTEPVVEPTVVQDAPVEWATLGHPAADAAINLLKAKGVDPAVGQKFFEKALKSGDVKDIDYDGLVGALGKDSADLVMVGAKQYAADTVVKAQANQTLAANEVGGMPVLEALSKWVQTKEAADPAFAAELEQIRAMMNTGPIGLKSGMRMLKDMHAKDPATKVGTAGLLVGTGAVPATTETSPLSREDFITGMRKWSTKAEFGDREAQQHVANLRQRRMAAMGRS